MKTAGEQAQMMQRIRVGLIGLAAVVLLIGLASAIIGSATTDPATTNAAVDVNMVLPASNTLADEGEPLADLGAAPGTNVQVSPSR
jgi:hypothetical protein